MEYLSLYDYLRKPAGEQLGKEVAVTAIQNKIPIQTRKVSNPKYTGTVNLYPKDFLDFYFKEPESIHMDDLENELDDLPF
jgi:hypothetical protein